MKNKLSFLRTFCTFSLLLLLLIFPYGKTLNASTGLLPAKQMFIWEGFAFHHVTQLTDTQGKNTGIINQRNYPQGLLLMRNLFYVLVGVSEHLNIFSGFIFQIPHEELPLFVDNIGDFNLGAKYRFFNGIKGIPISLSLTADIKFPLVKYPTETIRALGDNQTDFGLRLAFGYKFSYWNNRITNYIYPWVRYTARAELPPDNIGFGLQYKFSFPYNLHVKLSIAHHLSIGGYTETDAEYVKITQKDNEGLSARSALKLEYTVFAVSFEAGIANSVYLGISYATILQGKSTFIQHIYTLSVGVPIKL